MYEVIRSAFRRAGMGQNIRGVSLLSNLPRDDVIVPAEVEIPTSTPSTLPTSEISCLKTTLLVTLQKRSSKGYPAAKAP